MIGRNGSATKNSARVRVVRSEEGEFGTGQRVATLLSADPRGQADEPSDDMSDRRGPTEMPRGAAGRIEMAVRSHLTSVWRVLRRSGLRGADADDATQDVFWIFAQRQGDVPEVCTRAFLAATALRIASDRRRSKWNRSVTETVEEDLPEVGVSGPEEQLQNRRRVRLLDRVLTEMAPDEREIFILFEIEEMTRTEVAQALGIPEGTAASRLRRARDNFERLVARSQTGRGLANV